MINLHSQFTNNVGEDKLLGRSDVLKRVEILETLSRKFITTWTDECLRRENDSLINKAYPRVCKKRK